MLSPTARIDCRLGQSVSDVWYRAPLQRMLMMGAQRAVVRSVYISRVRLGGFLVMDHLGESLTKTRACYQGFKRYTKLQKYRQQHKWCEAERVCSSPPHCGRVHWCRSGSTQKTLNADATLMVLAHAKQMELGFGTFLCQCSSGK